MKTHTIHTSVGSALIDALVHAHEKTPNGQGKIKGLINDAWARNKHVVKRNDWNANLSYKTAKTLKNLGILV